MQFSSVTRLCCSFIGRPSMKEFTPLTTRLIRPYGTTTTGFSSSSSSNSSSSSSFFTNGGDVQEKNPINTYRGSTPIPCTTYWIGNTLYLAVTNRCNTVPLHRTRGPGFNLAERLSKAGFLPLSYDPSAEEILSGLEGALSASHSSFKPEQEVVFAGWGEPTLRWETALVVAEGIRTSHKNVKLRLSTNGLGNVANQRSIVSEASQVFHHVTVAVNTADAEQYEEMMHPDLTMRGESQTLRPISAYYTPTTVPPQQLQKALDQVTAFTRECVQHGLKTEVTAVARPDVNLGAVKNLAKNLGASFRSRQYFF